MNQAQQRKTPKRRVDDVAFEPINLQPKRLRFAPDLDLSASDEGTTSSDDCSLSMTEVDSESEYLSISESGTGSWMEEDQTKPMEAQDWGCILDALLMGGNKYIDLVDLCRLRGVNKMAKKKIDSK